MGPGQGNIRKGKEGTRWLKKLIVKTVVVLEVLVKKSLFSYKVYCFIFPIHYFSVFTPWKPLVPLLHIYYWNKLSAVQTHHYWLQPEFRKRISIGNGTLSQESTSIPSYLGCFIREVMSERLMGSQEKSFNPQSSWCQEQRQSLNFSRRIAASRCRLNVWAVESLDWCDGYLPLVLWGLWVDKEWTPGGSCETNLRKLKGSQQPQMCWICYSWKFSVSFWISETSSLKVQICLWCQVPHEV